MNAELTSKISLEQMRTLKEHCTITLGLPQYFFYQSEYIDIHAPDGSILESIGHRVKEMALEESTHRLHEQIFLLESLLGNLHQSIELPREAVSALADILYRMQAITSKAIK